MVDLDIVRKQYDSLGFDTIPLIKDSKKPYRRAWQKGLSYRLWQGTPKGTNIGIKGGGIADVAFIDCDELKTFKNITNFLAGLGYQGDSYPIVQTPSGEGRAHIYITFAGTLSGEARDLSKEIGAGEFRYGSGAFVVAPPSVISEGGYQLLSGDFSVRPIVDARDILPILGNREPAIKNKAALSRKALAILHGKGIDSYSSRSEAEQSLLASMANTGLLVEEVLELFNRYPCAGKYAALKIRNTKNAERWLRKSYNEAVQWTQNHESKARQSAKLAINWAEAKAWTGRTGAVDRLIYLAHANIAYRAGRTSYAAGCRDLAEMAGVNSATATHATMRLCNAGLIKLEKNHVADSANIYQLLCLDKVNHSPSTSIVRKWLSLSHDAFRYAGLGKSAGEIYSILQVNPASVKELAEITGRHIKTIKRALARMAKLTNPLTGEYLPMVASEDGETYHLLSIDLDNISHAVGTAGAAERQRREHARERRSHRRSLDLGRQSIKK